MSIVDNRTQLQDCDATADVSGDSDASPNSRTTEAGFVIEGPSAIQFQVTDAQEHILFDQDAGGSTFSIDFSDATIYINIKDNLSDTFANLGGLVCLNDGADGAGGDDIGYAAGGVDAIGLPYEKRYHAFKLDVSVVVAVPGSIFVYNGVEANLNHAAILQVGYGSIHLAKAQGTVPNAWFDGIYYIANDSYALTIQGGTVGTPETMPDVVGDDVAIGAAMTNNPKGSEFGFFAPTEWGTPSGTADSYFTASNEQWYFIGDNAGGHIVGATHFPFRLIGNATGTNSWAIDNIVMVNTGRRAEFDMSNADMDTATMLSCTLLGFGDIELPNAGTAKTTLGCTFSDCGNITSHGGDMTGSSVLVPSISANTSSLVWNENADPDGELDDMTFSKTSGVAHHAIEFGTSIPTTSITLRGCAFGTDFSATEDGAVGDETFHFLDTVGTITLNLVGCTGNFGYRTEGVVVTIVADPVTTAVNVKDENSANLQNCRVILETSDDTGDLPHVENITVTRSGVTATVVHTAHGIPDGTVSVIRGATDPLYNGPHLITVTGVNGYTYTMDGTPAASPAVGDRVSTGQDETNYVASFSGGTGHAVNDVIQLTGNGIFITVDAVSAGVITQFTVDSRDGRGGFSSGETLVQLSTDGSGTGFDMTLAAANLTVSASGAHLEGLTDVNGNISDSRTITNDQPLKGFARKTGSTPRYKSFPLSLICDNVIGVSASIMLTRND